MKSTINIRANIARIAMKLGELSSTNKAGIHETRAKILSAIQSSI